MLPPESAFCSNHDRKRTFLGRFESAFWNDVYSKISMDATAFCSNHVWKRWFWPQKLSMNAPRFESAFWNAVYSKSAFWNVVYSKISMDATAFCSNHVWKRWFWPQKLSINAPIFCEGRISVLKRWFKTSIQNAVHGSTVHASLEKKTISWACTAHCSRLLFELKWTGKAFIWRHLNVVICDFAFMLPPESAFCSNYDRKRTFLGVFNRRFETTFIRK